MLVEHFLMCNLFVFLQLDDWVLCRIYKKKNTARICEEEPKVDDFRTNNYTVADACVNDLPKLEFPRTSSLSHLWEMDYFGSISQLLNENTTSYDNQSIMTTMAPSRTVEMGGMSQSYADSLKFQVNNESNMLNQQSVFVNSIFEF